VLELAVNPDVIGGARVEVAGRLIDGTLTGRMARLMADVESAPA
jgi:F0F1-type ATP synthase delta subunit